MSVWYLDKWYRRIFMKLFCPHPVVKAPPTVNWKMNRDSKMRLECSVCSKVFYRYGREIELGRWREKVCFYEQHD